jgi:alkylhydroperoxidase family enzyme
MAWIRTIDDDDAAGPLADLYARIADPGTGRVDHVLRVHSLNPGGLAAHVAVYRAAMAGTRGLRKVDRELIAYAVSRLNGCHY